jgi:hypothetical protein
MKYEIWPFTWQGKTHRIYRRPRRVSGEYVAPATSDPWYHRIGNTWTSLQTHVKEDAVRIYKHHAAEHARDSNAWEQQRKAGLQRKAKPSTTLGELAALYPAAARAAGLKPKTVQDNLSALGVFVRTALGPIPDWLERPVTDLTGKSVFLFRQAVTAASEDLDPGDQASAMRSANSTLAKVKSILSPAACEHYRLAGGIELPASLAEFRTAPGFRDVTKHDYEIPDAARIQATLQDLETTKDQFPNRYVTCWLAIGFGLRKSEAACVRRDWFRVIDGRWHIEIRAVADAMDATTERPSTKNGQIRPLIPCANGAWEKLSPYIQAPGCAPDSYLIEGTDTYRRGDVFREISVWLRHHGWETQKAYHELRAWAGCQVGMAFGFDVASQWLRHGSIVTTQKFYGRYLNTLRKVDDRPAVTFPTPAAPVSQPVSQASQVA